MVVASLFARITSKVFALVLGNPLYIKYTGGALCDDNSSRSSTAKHLCTASSSLLLCCKSYFQSFAGLNSSKFEIIGSEKVDFDPLSSSRIS